MSLKNCIFTAVVISIFMLSFVFVGAGTKYPKANALSLHHLISWNDHEDSTFEKAKKEDKPIFLLIAAPAWCHWCNVYESQDYLYNNMPW